MKFKVTELSHDDLVNLISTALYGNYSMGIDFSSSAWDKLKKEQKTDNPCFEDKCADLLLAGKSVKIADYDAEDYGLNGTKGKMVKNTGWSNCCAKEVGVYNISLQDILDGCSTEEGMGYAQSLFVDEDGDFYTGYNLIQIIMFGEVVYG